MEIENNKECFVMLWRKLERTRRLLGGQYKRFCVRRVIQTLSPTLSRQKGEGVNTFKKWDDFVWEVCRLAELEGYQELPLPALYPRPHRELLRAFVSTYLGIGMRAVDLKALDEAYSVVFPRSTPINVNKKARS